MRIGHPKEKLFKINRCKGAGCWCPDERTSSVCCVIFVTWTIPYQAVNIRTSDYELFFFSQRSIYCFTPVISSQTLLAWKNQRYVMRSQFQTHSPDRVAVYKAQGEFWAHTQPQQQYKKTHTHTHTETDSHKLHVQVRHFRLLVPGLSDCLNRHGPTHTRFEMRMKNYRPLRMAGGSL